MNTVWRLSSDAIWRRKPARREERCLLQRTGGAGSRSAATAKLCGCLLSGASARWLRGRCRKSYSSPSLWVCAICCLYRTACCLFFSDFLGFCIALAGVCSRAWARVGQALVARWLRQSASRGQRGQPVNVHCGASDVSSADAAATPRAVASRASPASFHFSSLSKSIPLALTGYHSS